MKSYLQVCVLFASILASSITAHAQSSDSTQRAPNTMSIVGQGQYWTKPEIAEFSGDVVTKGDTLAKARDTHPNIAQQARATINEFVDTGLKLESAQYTVREIDPCNDVYTSVLRRDSVTECDKPSYFEATTSFRFSTDNLADLGDMISKLASGDLQLSRIHFSVKNGRAPLLEARKDAARDALGQATAYADALGVTLVDIRNVTDGDAQPAVEEYADLAILTSADGKTPLEIAIPDQLQFSASVKVDWTIKQPTL